MFTGNFAVSNFGLTNDNADGSVNLSNAPTSITLTGGNNQSFDLGTTTFSITSPESGTLNFAWNYLSMETAMTSFADSFIFLFNGTSIQLTDDFGAVNQSGTFTIAIGIGDTFGFEILTADNLGGSASVTVSQNGVPVPFEFSPLLGLSVVGGLFAAKKFMKKARPQK